MKIYVIMVVLAFSMTLFLGTSANGQFQYLNESGKPGGAYNPSSSPQPWIKTATNNWMGDLADSTLIKNISLPGTHDSGALYGGAAAQTQTWTIQQQLEAGIRYFDIRTRTMKDGSLTIHHGSFYQNQTFGGVMNTASAFLKAHPREVIVLQVKANEHTAEEGSSANQFSDNWNAYMATYSNIVAKNPVPESTLGYLRGKVLIIQSNFSHPTTGIKKSGNPIFDSQDYYKVYWLAGDGFSGTESANLPGKKKKVIEYLDRATVSQSWVLNYLSGSTGMIPSDVARATNSTADEHLGGNAGKRKLGTILMDFPGEQLIYRIIKSNFKLNGTGYHLQISTPLSEGNNNYTFLLSANGDLFAIQKSGTGSGKTEVHVLSAASNYQAFILQTPTALHETDTNFDFVLAQNGDLFAIKTGGTGAGKTELHVLSKTSAYKTFILKTPTALEETGANFSFLLAPNRDLIAIKRRNTGSGKTEVHVLTAASGYKQFSLQTATPLPETDASYEFALAPNWDLFVIRKSKTGSRSTEVHVLSVASKYQQFILQTGTVLPETDSSFWFGVTSERNLFAIKKSNTGTKSTEIHIVDLP